MSWIFGYKKPTLDLPSQGVGNSNDGPSSGGVAGNNNPPTGNADSKLFAGHESIYKFDSSALERAARAAKELERSRKFNTLKSLDCFDLLIYSFFLHFSTRKSSIRCC